MVTCMEVNHLEKCHANANPFHKSNSSLQTQHTCTWFEVVGNNPDLWMAAGTAWGWVGPGGEILRWAWTKDPGEGGMHIFFFGFGWSLVELYYNVLCVYIYIYTYYLFIMNYDDYIVLLINCMCFVNGKGHVICLRFFLTWFLRVSPCGIFQEYQWYQWTHKNPKVSWNIFILLRFLGPMFSWNSTG